MKSILIILLFSVNAFAGTALLTLVESGGKADVNEFRMTWSLDNNVTYTTINLGFPDPVSTGNDGLRTWKITLTNSLWLPSAKVCFMAKALKDGAKVGQSNLACKVMPAAPNEPVIIGVDIK